MKTHNAITLALTAATMAMNQIPSSVHAFVPSSSSFSATRHTTQQTHLQQQSSRRQQRSYSRSTPNSSPRRFFLQLMAASKEELETEISAMRAKEIRQELESYGISTKSFFEKSELVDALVQARMDGKTPVENNVNGVNGDDASTSSSSSGGGGASTAATTRQERIQQEMEKCKSLKVGELKKELESYGISTKSYFEKSEFVKAVAEARVDGVVKSAGGGSGSGRGASSAREEPRDPSFRDVTVSKFQDKGMLSGKVIDVKCR